MSYLSYYLIIINIVNFLIFALDKQRAKRDKWRIPEAWLFFLSLIGGSFGGLLSMNVMKHKTQKISFAIGIPILLIVNAISFFYLNKLF